MSGYAQFLESKAAVQQMSGVLKSRHELPPKMFDFQKDLVVWALRKGRTAIFADTGLGKTFMHLAWSVFAAERALILAPLAVGKQTVKEAGKWDIGPIRYAKSQEEAGPGITISNYERADKFDASYFGAVVLDESSILKSYDGKTRTALIKQFARVPMRLCCTATPAPNGKGARDDFDGYGG